MPTDKPTTKTCNAHFLKGHASWLYCDGCNKTVAYLCYVTYRYFRFSFTCMCGAQGWVENQYDDVDPGSLLHGDLVQKGTRFCCANDESPLFSVVSKHLKSYQADVVCKQCNVHLSNGSDMQTKI